MSDIKDYALSLFVGCVVSVVTHFNGIASGMSVGAVLLAFIILTAE